MLTNTKNDKSILAAGIDIGSNSVRMLIAEVSGDKIVRLVDSDRATTRLATDIARTGVLSPEPLQKTIDVLERFNELIKKYNIQKVRAFATSAVREASNSYEFIDRASLMGINIETISGLKEADLVYKGVRAGIDITEPTFIFDAGGGSTEFIVSGNDKVLFADSFKIGVVKLVDIFDMRNDVFANIEACKSYISDFFKDFDFDENPCKKVIATAGTATTVAAIKQGLKEYDWTKVNGFELSIDDIKSILERVASTEFSKRIEIDGMDRGREDLIIPGMLIMLEVMARGRFKTLTVSDFGLREGAVIAAANS